VPGRHTTTRLVPFRNTLYGGAAKCDNPLMSFLSSGKAIGSTLGLWRTEVLPIGCTLGRTIYRETKRAAQVANFRRPWQRLRPETVAMLRGLFPDLDASRIRYRTRCLLPPNRFRESGSILAMTFGYTIYWRGNFDPSNPVDIVNFIHEVVHVDQVRRLGGEEAFACEYGKAYLDGGGVLPGYIRRPTIYHRNQLEAEAYNFEAQFQDEHGRVVAERIPWIT